ncbi:hypothetical protein FisN_11Hu292 [Fistulifera solaris]|jgi:hypothetical protein|uniref:Uncharacterized protein n=1 Tax=Fistulifera solaris TaxID=1519565 RepID=A0A1Z5JLT5_FISSO|nr:hypothetical protein FisN_11Hu292 [Fistulifera solaris]|eukprot:GAX14748.1 hypothetical protein FisN_11Hu292 [Fistulifera solaris]
MTARDISRFIQILIDEGYCWTYEEADAIVNTVEDEQGLHEYLGIALPEAQSLWRKVHESEPNDDDDDSSQSEEVEEEEFIAKSEDDDTAAYLGEGECELCERSMRLTRHHLVPRCTWSRLEPRMLRALEGSSSVDGLESLLDRIQTSDAFTNKQRVRQALQMTCAICRPCHTTIHQTHDNVTLALQFNTVDKLLEDKTIYSFCQWANKQRRGKLGMK